MIIDTMVFAYALLEVEDKSEEALAILTQADRIVVPDSLRVELANVAWQWVKFKGVSETIAQSLLQDADALIDQVVSSDKVWVQALQLAIESDHPVYDTLFVATALACEDKVVTYDKKLRVKFPDYVQSPQSFLE